MGSTRGAHSGKGMQSGDTCGGYLLGDELGEGYFATVFRCGDKAIKIMRSKYYDEGWDEARLWSRIRSTNAVPLLEHFMADLDGRRVKAKRRPKPPQPLRHVFVMPVIEGNELYHWVEQYEEAGRLPPQHVVAGVARDILRGMVALREAHIVHTDIKPENVLVHSAATTLDEFESMPFTALLADFGCCCDDD